MTEKTEDNKMEALPDLDDLLQCPVCYEIPSGQIFQCNEGHHVCGRCKMRLDVCPVCRAFFFGTRNYAMEELIANVRKLRAFKLGGKVTTGSPPAEVTPEVPESSSEGNESANENVEDDNSSRTSVRPPLACRGLFRCLCCKNNPERLPLARLLNHLRYYHSPDLIEGRSENGGYLQAWQFPTVPGRMVTAVRVHDMGIFFLVIEITHESVHAWMSMAASPWVAHEFSYSFTLSGNDREAIFSDCVWSVRSCEGSLKRRSRCLCVTGGDARALLAPAAMSGKLSVRRTPHELQPGAAQPRAVLRVANRSHAPPDAAHDLEPFLQDLQNDVARLSRAFATLGREANALVRSEAEMRARLVSTPAPAPAPAPAAPSPAAERPPAPQPPPSDRSDNSEPQLSRNARRRMRQRLREAFRESQATQPSASTVAAGAAAAAAPLAPRPRARRGPSGAALHNGTAAVTNLNAGDHARTGDVRIATILADPSSNLNVTPRPQSAQVVGSATRVPNVNRTPVDVDRSNGSINSSIPVRTTGDRTSGVPVRATGGQNTGNLVRATGGQNTGNPVRATGGQNTGNPVRATSGQNTGNPLRAAGGAPTNTDRLTSHGVSSAVIYDLASRGLSLPSGTPLAPPPVPPPAFGGPSQGRPSNGNTRNKKRRQRR